jgi:DNA-binding transcriptional regulator LsrR (DeoR family)
VTLTPVWKNNATEDDVIIRCTRAFATAFAKSPADPKLREIAKAAGCSRNLVRRYLSEAANRGYMSLQVTLPKHRQLSDHLRQTYGLAEAVVTLTPTDWTSQKSIRSALSIDLIRYVEQFCKCLLGEKPSTETIRIGTDGGQTLYQAVQAAGLVEFPPARYDIVPLVFGPLEGTRFTASVVANVLASKMEESGARASVREPFRVREQRAQTETRGRRRIELLLDMAPRKTVSELDLLLVGIGSRSAGLLQRELHLLQKPHFDFGRYAGDICNLAFDDNGREIASISQTRTVLLTLDVLQRISHEPNTLVVSAAGGKDKMEAIRAVLKAGYVSVLITDPNTADVLVESSLAPEVTL